MTDIRTAAQSGQKLIHDFRGDDVWRDDEGMIWQRMSDTEKAVKATIGITIARVTPTREQLIDALAARHWDRDSGEVEHWDELTDNEKENVIENYNVRDSADAILRLIAGLAEGES